MHWVIDAKSVIMGQRKGATAACFDAPAILFGLQDGIVRRFMTAHHTEIVVQHKECIASLSKFEDLLATVSVTG